MSTRPYRVVFLWQVAATAGLSLVAAVLWGRYGALSAALGGSINVAAGAAYGWVVSRRKARSAGETLVTMFKAEAVKILLVVALLWLAMAGGRWLVPGIFLGSFVVTVALFAAAIAVRDEDEGNMPPRAGER
ncbi:MAG TPA: ATP synthase subunit I [Usitatibacter sp.]|nr:ATP synthase subunit I [Usitatibacter sp.]